LSIRRRTFQVTQKKQREMCANTNYHNAVQLLFPCFE
jgi:hypothetical protein